MKYIRTKDAVMEYKKAIENIKYWFKNVAFEDDEYNIDTETDRLNKSIIKQADTIEELCDEFDWKWNEKEFPYSKVRQHDRYSGYGDLKRAIREEENYGKYLNQDYEIYGAIWTDKGLQFVARMNSEGALELL